MRHIGCMENRHSISRRRLLAYAGAAALTPVPAARAAAENPVVVELFTSQGCSSCPPADKLLGEIRTMPGVVAMSYHVDYWDYLGWQDTLASKENSQRQYDYAKARGDMDVYTPQVIVNGGNPQVGSNRTGLLAAIETARQRPLPVSLSIAGTAKEIVLTIGGHPALDDAMVWLMPLQRDALVKILKGEIAGSEIAYYNVVRKILPAGMWAGRETRLTLPADGVLPPDSKSCVALLQIGKAGPIIGCGAWGELGA